MFYESRSPFLSMLRSHHMGSLLSCGLHQGGHFMEICIIFAWRTGEHILNWLLNQICKFFFAVSTPGIVVKYWGKTMQHTDSCGSILQGNFFCLIPRTNQNKFCTFYRVSVLCDFDVKSLGTLQFKWLNCICDCTMSVFLNVVVLKCNSAKLSWPRHPQKNFFEQSRFQLT